MKTYFKVLMLLLSILLVFTSIPWHMVQAEGNLADYEERLGLNDAENAYTLPMEDPEADIAAPVYSTDEADFPPEGELVEERTAISKVFSNGDGTFTEEIYPEPVHTEAEAGEWEDISTDLIESLESDFISGENTQLEVEFPTEVEEAYVAIQHEDQQISYELIAAEGPAASEEALVPTLEYEDNVMYHREIFPNIDLRSILFDTSLKEDIILQVPSELDTFHFQVHTELNGELLADGSIEWTNDETVVFVTPPPVMVDANVDELSGEAPRSDDVTFSLEANEQGYLLTISADAEWLNDPERVYPIYIDPTTSLPTSADTFVSSAWPNANYDAYWDPNVGYYSLRSGYFDSSTGTQFSFFQQNVSHLKGATIDSAEFNLYTSHSYYPTTATGVWLDTVNAAWSPTTVTWNNKPASSALTSTQVYKGQWAKFNVTSTVQQWASGAKANHGFKIHNNGNGQTFWKRYYASENSTNKPYLSVTYSYPKPAVPTVTPVNYNNGTDTGYLDVTWPTVPGAVDYIVQLYNGREYQGFKTGNVTSWSTRGKKIWPTDEQLYNGTYQLSDTGKGQELPIDPRDTYDVSGGIYAESTRYWVRVTAVYSAGSSAMSDPARTYLPLSKPTGIKGAASINLDDASGYLSMSWDPTPLATGYKVLLFNGKAYEEVADIPVDKNKPDQALQWHSQGKKVWPTPADVSAGRFAIRANGTGVELPKDPTPVYQASGGTYGSNKNYYVRVKAYRADHPESVQSNAFKTLIPDKENPLGDEAFWPSLSSPAGSVNAINGNLTFSETDASFSGRGPAVQLSRTYNSLSDQLGSFGRGWLFSYDMKVQELANKDVRLTEEDGTIHVYKYSSSNGYVQPHGLYLPLEKSGDQFILTTKSQDKLYFTNGRLTKIEDGERKENAVTLNWTAAQVTITDASGRAIVATLSNNRITQVKDYSGRTWSYTYSGDQLTGYTDPTGAVYRYGYTNGQLTSITDALGKSKILTYDASKRLASVKDAVGKTTTLAYGATHATITHPGTPTSAGSNVTSIDRIDFNTAGNPVSLTTDTGTGKLNLKTTYTYVLHELVKTVDPRQGTETAVYDAEGNVLEVVGANGEAVSASYNENNDLVSFTDAMEESYTTAYDGLLEVSSNDPSKTSAVTEYDAFGNVAKSSKDMSVAFNHLSNAGFEASSTGYPGWTLRRHNGDTGTAALTTAGAKQNQAITLTPNPSPTLPSGTLSYVAVTQDIPVEGNTLYTLSGLLKTANLGGRAFLNVGVMGGSTPTQWVDNRYHYLTGTNSEWTERQLSFITKADAKTVRIYLEVDNASKGLSGGTATFDNIQLEYGQVSSSFNPVINSGFEAFNAAAPATFPGWETSALKGVYEKVKVDEYGEVEENENVFDGKFAVKVLRKQANDPVFVMKQVIPINQTTAAPLTASALSKAENALNGTASTGTGAYGVTLRARDKDGVEMGPSVGYFALGTHEWQKAIASVNPPRPIKEVTVEFSFRGQMTGTVWFDSIRIQEGRVLSTNAYDAKGNHLLSEQDVAGNSTSYKYDDAGNLLEKKDAKGNVTGYTYTKQNQLKTTSLPGSDAEVVYEYDANGSNTAKTVRSKENSSTVFGKTSYVFDDAGQLLNQSVETPDKNYTTSFQYNARGEIQKTIYPTGSQVSLLYDSADRPTGVTHTLPDGATEQIAAFTLDGNGNQIEVHNLLTNTKQFQEFDKGNRVIRQTNGTSLTNGPSIAWKFDKNDNVTEETITNGSVSYPHLFKYNALNYNTEVVAPGSKSFRFQYDEAGNVKSYSGPNGTGALFDYDERELVTSINIGHNDIIGLAKFGYVYDAVGNRTEQSITQQFASRANLTGKSLYTYDTMSQLTSETVPLTGEKLDYTYDVLGNRTQTVKTKSGSPTHTTVHVFNDRNQLIEVKDGTSSTQWAYDDNGNLLNDGHFRYEWDADNRLRKVFNQVTDSLVAEYWYDQADRRIRKNVSGFITNYIYDGDGLNVLYETNASNTITAYHTYNVNRQLLMRTEGSTRYYYHYNAHGDVIMVTKDGGNIKADLIVASYVYDAWGKIVYQEGPFAAKNPYRYAGYQFDPETNHYYLMARYYNPEFGVFTSKDPYYGDEENLLTQNGYSYANNNPVMLIDPDGYRGKKSNPLGNLNGSGSVKGLKISSPPKSTYSGIIKKPNSSYTKVPFRHNSLTHIFKKHPSHFRYNTASNRALLQSTASQSRYLRGVDSRGNTWHSRTLRSGVQIWTQSRNGKIFNGGRNLKPRKWDPKRGLVE